MRVRLLVAVLLLAIGAILLQALNNGESIDPGMPGTADSNARADTAAANTLAGHSADPQPIEAGAAEERTSQAAPADEEDEPAQERARINVHGRVIDGDGAALANVVVWSQRPGSLRESTRSDPSGNYNIIVSVGSCDLLAKAPASLLARASVMIDTATSDWSGPDLICIAGLTSAGRMVDAAGQAVPGIPVEALDPESNAWSFVIQGQAIEVGRASSVSDEQGRFVLSGLDDALHDVLLNLTYRPDLLCDAAVQHQVRPGTEVLFRVRNHGEVALRIVDDVSGLPIQKLRIAGRELRHAEGLYRAELNETGKLHLSARGYENLMVEPPAQLSTADVEPLLVRLNPLADVGQLRLTLSDDAGDPLREVLIEGNGPHNHQWSEDRAESGVAGVYQLQRLPAGSHELHLSAALVVNLTLEALPLHSQAATAHLASGLFFPRNQALLTPQTPLSRLPGSLWRYAQMRWLPAGVYALEATSRL